MRVRVRRVMHGRQRFCVLALALSSAACRAPEVARQSLPIAAPAPALNDEIVICGQRFHTGAPVVLWTEPPYYDASKWAPRFKAASSDPVKPGTPRYQPGRARKIPNPIFKPAVEGTQDERTDVEKRPTLDETVVAAGTHDLAALQDFVDQFVVHYDVCGLSRTCFRVLQDDRHISVHFMLDIDGTIYQTLDCRDTAWHAKKSNSRSVGVEIANMGAYAPARSSTLDDWYSRDARGTYIKVPERITETGVRTPGFVGRPARDERVTGRIQGQTLEQYDFTPEQYASLVKLAATLCTALPKIRPEAPRDAQGHVVDHVLSDAEWLDFSGIVGHYHVQVEKTDPGPAFDWETFLEHVRARMREIAAESR